MIYITGDTHGEQNRILHIENNCDIGKGDYLVVCGDFGYLYKNDKSENFFLDILEERPYTICFCDGNHENFPAIYSYPEEVWNGGRIHRIRKNIIHLMRGQMYDIESKTFFTMGGAYSIDKYMRRENVEWWADELPNSNEYNEAIANLEKCGHSVDYILTHTAPTKVVRRVFLKDGSIDIHEAELCGFLEWVMYETNFRKWFFGHWHADLEIDEKFRALHYDIERL